MSTELDNVLSGIIVLLLIVVIYKWYVSRSSCSEKSTLPCGCRAGHCRCRSVRKSRRGGTACPYGYPEGMKTREKFSESNPEDRVTGSVQYDISGAQDYAEATKKMSLEQDVSDSHQKWCDALTFNGLSTGASSCTTLEETGRSFGTSDFVGLTARKWCKARQLATPAPDSRNIPSHEVSEYCGVQMNELI